MKKNNQNKDTNYSASSSLLGYLYQCKYALLDALRRIKQVDDFICQLEVLDDVQFESGSNVTAILQTKHHISKKASLSNASPDFWKSIRIWAQFIFPFIFYIFSQIFK